MARDPLPDLKSRLVTSAQAWADAHEAPLTRIAKRVTGDAKFFDRLAAGAGFNIGTLEKFAIELVDPASWPDGKVPEDVVAFGHAVGVTPPVADLSAGKDGGISPQRDAA